MSTDALQHLARADKVMARVIERVGPCAWKPRRRRSPFETLVQSVAYQQLNGTAAATIFGRVKALYPGKPFPSPADLLATPDRQLRGAGLSRSKIAAIKDIAANTLSGVVPTSRAIARLDDEAILSRLTTIRGVGPWTVHMLLIFKLGRPDVLPVTDFGVRKGFAVAYGLADLPDPRELLAHGEKWRPYRSFAAWYLWRVLDLPEPTRRDKGRSRPAAPTP
jgi:DNA-3-methyladenine glycosylase II